MTGSKIFLDTNPVIYFLELDDTYYDAMERFFIENKSARYVTSVVTVAEYFVMPFRDDEEDRIRFFNSFIEEMDVDILDVNRSIAEKAAQIRAIYRSFKAMDSLQLAAAVISGCDLFLTNDLKLGQFREIPVQMAK